MKEEEYYYRSRYWNCCYIDEIVNKGNHKGNNDTNGQKYLTYNSTENYHNYDRPITNKINADSNDNTRDNNTCKYRYFSY